MYIVHIWDMYSIKFITDFFFLIRTFQRTYLTQLVRTLGCRNKKKYYPTKISTIFISLGSKNFKLFKIHKNPNFKIKIRTVRLKIIGTNNNIFCYTHKSINVKKITIYLLVICCSYIFIHH